VDNGSTVSVPSAPVRSGHRACTWQRWCPAARTSRPPPSPVRQADRADGRFPCPPLYDQGPIAAVIDVVVDWTPVDSDADPMVPASRRAGGSGRHTGASLKEDDAPETTSGGGSSNLRPPRFGQPKGEGT